MKETGLAILALIFISCAALADSGGVVNVRDYGAKGDGVTDDTAAIRAAAKAAAVTVHEPSSAGLYVQAGPALVFPAGKYIISDDIPVNCLEVRGEGRPIIQQTNKDKDIFKADAWRNSIRNISFSGGRNQIDLRNKNLDTGQVIIEHCQFYQAGGFAVYTDVLSTTVKINDCIFYQNHQTWFLGRSDQAVMRDCWITTSADMKDAAVIVNRGANLMLENICGVPLTGAPRQRWIDNYGALVCLRFRFGAEGGGFTPVYNYTKYQSSTWGPSVILEECLIFANASATANCAVYCYEIPNTIRVRDCTLGGSTGVTVDRSIDLSKYFAAAGSGMFSFSVEGCTGEMIGQLPKGLAKPKVNPVPLPKGMLDAKQTKAALAQAEKDWKARKEELEQPGAAGGHTQKLEPGSYVEATDWSVSGYMDATTQPNSDWLAMKKVGSDHLLMFRQPQPGGWPHVTIRGTVDLDKYPFLTWRQKQGTAPGAFSLKIVDEDTGALATLADLIQWSEYEYYSVDLKEKLGWRGKRTLEVRFYPISSGYEYPSANAGDYVVLSFVRFEAR